MQCVSARGRTFFMERKLYYADMKEFECEQRWNAQVEQEIRKAFTERVRGLMRRYNVSVGEVAVHVGVFTQMLEETLENENFPSVEVLLRLAAFFRTSVSYLLGQ